MAGGYTLTEGAIRKLAGLVRGGMTEARRGASSPSAVSFDGYALPFTVRWAASEGQSGAWVVWLPTLADLVTYAGAACTLSGVAAATSLPAGWYTVANAATAMYLIVTVPDPTESEPDPSATAELSAAPGTAGTGETVYNLLVATMSTNATTGAKRVKQYVVGSVALGGGGGEAAQAVTVRDDTFAIIDVDTMPVNPTDPEYDASHPGDVRFAVGELLIGDGQQGTTEGELYIKDAENPKYIMSRRIVPGEGIAVDVDGRDIVISADPEEYETSGYTGTRTILADVDYDPAYHTLRRRYITEEWEDGLLQETTLGEWEVYHTAVEETVYTVSSGGGS